MRKGPLAVLVLVLLAAQAAWAQDFVYFAPGKLQPSPKGKTSGKGDDANRKIYAPGMMLPVELKDGDAIFPNSQVYRPGGLFGGGGGQCTSMNYQMPWADVFCEIRDHGTPMCPGGKGHQGIDIRPPGCKDKTYFAVATEDGTIAGVNPRTSSVTLKGKTGTTYLFLHLDPPTILVKVNDKVKAGQRLGKISNWMNGKPDTTIHLHFEIKQTVSFKGETTNLHVPVYTSLVNAFRKHLKLPDVAKDGVLGPDPQREK